MSTLPAAATHRPELLAMNSTEKSALAAIMQPARVLRRTRMTFLLIATGARDAVSAFCAIQRAESAPNA
jgi:hypothetical protein